MKIKLRLYATLQKYLPAQSSNGETNQVGCACAPIDDDDGAQTHPTTMRGGQA